MEDDFDFPTGEDMDMDMDVPEEEEDPVSPSPFKVGEEKEIGKNGLKKKLLKQGEGWETPASGDQVEGMFVFRRVFVVGYLGFLC